MAGEKIEISDYSFTAGVLVLKLRMGPWHGSVEVGSAAARGIAMEVLHGQSDHLVWLPPSTVHREKLPSHVENTGRLA